MKVGELVDLSNQHKDKVRWMLDVKYPNMDKFEKERLALRARQSYTVGFIDGLMQRGANNKAGL